MILPIEGDAARGWTAGTPTVFLATPATEIYAMFSPDGRWVAYASNEVGSTYDVFVRPFPGPGGPRRISTGGGTFPHWSPRAHELLFLGSGGKVFFAPYAVVGEAFQVDKPQVWTPTSAVSFGTSYPYDIHPDGKRLALTAAVDQAGVVQDKVVFVSNFIEYLKKTVAGRK